MCARHLIHARVQEHEQSWVCRNINQWFTGQTRGRVARGNNATKLMIYSHQQSARGLPFPAHWNAITQRESEVVQFANKLFFSWLYQSFPLQTGQAMISSNDDP